MLSVHLLLCHQKSLSCHRPHPPLQVPGLLPEYFLVLEKIISWKKSLSCFLDEILSAHIS